MDTCKEDKKKLTNKFPIETNIDDMQRSIERGFHEIVLFILSAKYSAKIRKIDGFRNRVIRLKAG